MSKSAMVLAGPAATEAGIALWLREFMDPVRDPRYDYGNTYLALYRCTLKLGARVVMDTVVAGIEDNVPLWYAELIRGAKTVAQLQRRLRALADIVMYARRTVEDRAMLTRIWREGIVKNAQASRIMSLSGFPPDVLLEIGRYL